MNSSYWPTDSCWFWKWLQCDLRHAVDNRLWTFFACEISLMWLYLNDFRLFDWQHANTGQFPERSALCGTDWDQVVWFELRAHCSRGPPPSRWWRNALLCFLFPFACVCCSSSFERPADRLTGSDNPSVHTHAALRKGQESASPNTTQTQATKLVRATRGVWQMPARAWPPLYCLLPLPWMCPPWHTISGSLACAVALPSGAAKINRMLR